MGGVLPAVECSYVIGNPPFLGASNCSAEQKQQIVDLFGKIKLSNSLDYVSGWYYKACEYIQGTPIRCAFVSTNSIAQGEQVAPIWQTLYEQFEIHIDFAYRTFRWSSEANDIAHVFVIIIGFSSGTVIGKPILFQFETVDSEPVREEHDHINFYLVSAPDVFLSSRSKPISDVNPLTKGNQPSDGGFLILTKEEAEELVSINETIKDYVKEYVGARELINGFVRYCLWLKDAPNQVLALPEVKQRLEAVRDFRAASTAKPTRDKAKCPHLFFSNPQGSGTYLAIPRVSSERRRYIPIAFLTPKTIASDGVSIINDASMYHFGVLTSQFHNAWMRTVAGRLKSDYRYSGGVVYNNFVWPEPTPDQKSEIERLAQSILDIRDAYPDKSLADLYDPDKMPSDLLAAHKALDKAVEEAYGVDFDGDEEKIVTHLFKLYAEATEGE